MSAEWGSVLIVFPDGAARWDVAHERWSELPTSLEAWRGAIPNFDEWAAFWRSEPRAGLSIDHRDLAFDGRPIQEPDWSYRQRRWIAERGRGVPADADLDPSYVIQRLDDGWALMDTILMRVVMYVSVSEA